MTDKETKAPVVHEQLEKPVVQKVVEKPVVTETFAKTEVRKEGTTDAALLKEDAAFRAADAKVNLAKPLPKEEVLLEDEEWVTDENGQRKKQKKGFFGQLKDKITGHL